MNYGVATTVMVAIILLILLLALFNIVQLA